MLNLSKHRIFFIITNTMNIFIDTNIFLSFYNLTSDELEELKKLVVLLRKKKVVLLLPEQVIHEFRRNRAKKISEAISKLQSQLALVHERVDKRGVRK